MHRKGNHRGEASGAPVASALHATRPPVAAAPAAQPPVAAVQAEAHKAHVSPDFLSTAQFATLDIHEETKRALREKFQYDIMTKVQAAAIPVASTGISVLAKARTGTGKTLAFSIPCVERLLRIAPRDRVGVGALVLSPTRELALQIHSEITTLITFYRGLHTVVVFGGTNIRTDQRRLDVPRVDILVATPGRLIDHLENTDGFGGKIRRVTMLVIDEADRCLDMGFRPSILKILSFLPENLAGVQTMLFSATIPQELVALVPQLLGTKFELIDAVSGAASLATTSTAAPAKHHGGGGSAKASAADGAPSAAAPVVLHADNPFATAAQVKQDYVIVRDASAQFYAAYHLLEEERRRYPDSHKIIVFFTTARMTQLFAELFNAMGLRTLEIHSRQSQGARQRASDEFRDTQGVTMFSSDVTARGMDYPDVSLVLQIGLPANAEQYIHRLGRTARAGKEGRGTLVLMKDEAFFLQQKEVRQLPLKDVSSSLPAPSRAVEDKIYAGMKRVSATTKAQAYAAWLGYYNSAKMRWSKEELVQHANDLALNGLGLSSPPAIQKKTVGKMGLRGVPGLVLESGEVSAQRRGGNGGGGRGGKANAAVTGYSQEYDDDDDDDDQAAPVSNAGRQQQSRAAVGGSQGFSVKASYAQGSYPPWQQQQQQQQHQQGYRAPGEVGGRGGQRGVAPQVRGEQQQHQQQQPRGSTNSGRFFVSEERDVPFRRRDDGFEERRVRGRSDGFAPIRGGGARPAYRDPTNQGFY